MKLTYSKADLTVSARIIRYRQDFYKAIITMITVLIGCGAVIAQKKEIQTNNELSHNLESADRVPEIQKIGNSEERDAEQELTAAQPAEANDAISDASEALKDSETVVAVDRDFFLKPEFRTNNTRKEVPPLDPIDDDQNSQSGAYERFHWKPALAESLYFLGIQHGFRTIQKKTRREFKGPFFADWGTSVKNLGKWKDGDSAATNYFAHPLQGAVTGRIFVNNSDRSKRQEFGSSKEYWESRFKAMIWSAVWSTQFELGPISEASLGNVGLYDRRGPNRMGWVDLVITPTAGTGVMIGEDMIDKYILKKWLERKIKSKTKIMIYRTFFTPIQSFTNVLGGKRPWNRDNR
ncbi:MAG: hypothetical protein KDB79_16760 [Acidobacteria bacterium]|nr:hypothetical protein [Acidobacteriota bacterium]